jgi:hypothetical protein
MESIEAIYKFGNLYEKNSRKRILINDGAAVTIIMNEEDKLSDDPNLVHPEILDAAAKEKQVSDFISKEYYWKLFDSGTWLYFEISAGVKRREGKQPIRTRFKVKLLEDLYIYNKKEDVKYARFFDCLCLVEECLSDFEFFEPIYATSLNDAYTKTYELYFAMFGKSTCNAFDRFSKAEDMRVMIRGLTESIQQRPSI